MINLLKKIFRDNNFKIHEGIEKEFTTIENGFLGVLEEGKNGRYNYYLVVEINSISDFRVKDNNPVSYRRLFEYIRSLDIYNPYFEKNLSLLVVWEVSNLDISELDETEGQPLRRYISDIEENPYFFKKQVLFYNKKELELFAEKFNVIEDKFTSFLALQLSNEISFTNFKKNNYIPTYYTLLARLFIKISFLRMYVKEMDLEDLQILIDGKLGQLTTIKRMILTSDKWETFAEGYEELIDKLYDQINSEDE